MNARTEHGEILKVILIPKAGEDLRRLQERTNLSRTDLANRAITLYEFIDAQLRAGRDMIAWDKESGMTELVQLLDATGGQAQLAAPAHPRRGLASPERRPGRHQRQFIPLGKPARLLPLAGLSGQEMRTT
jgi:hypothetical protein